MKAFFSLGKLTRKKKLYKKKKGKTNGAWGHHAEREDGGPLARGPKGLNN